LVAKNSSNVIGPYLVVRNLLPTLSFDELKTITDNFDPSIEDTKYVQNLKNRVEILSKVQIGKTAADFTLNTPKGEPFTLSSLKGDYLLIDFWASWCGHCRRENPHIVKLYQDYKDKIIFTYFYPKPRVSVSQYPGCFHSSYPKHPVMRLRRNNRGFKYSMNQPLINTDFHGNNCYCFLRSIRVNPWLNSTAIPITIPRPDDFIKERNEYPLSCHPRRSLSGIHPTTSILDSR